MNLKKILYWITTALMCALFLFSAQMYLFNTEMVFGFFENMGFPTWIVIPLAIVKILGVTAVLSNFNRLLSEWAYAGFFFDVILATAAHHFAGHGWLGLSFAGILLVIASRVLLPYRNAD